MRMTKIVFALAAAVGCTACAGVKFQRYETDADGKRALQEVGYPLYTPKPHLLVMRTGSKEKPVDVSVIYLPDQTDKGTIYAKFEPGFFGASNLTMALANGQLTSLGQQSDGKLPELLSGISGMITAQAGADKLAAETIKLLTDAGRFDEQSAIPYDEIGDEAVRIADNIARDAASTNFKAGLTDTQRGDLGKIADATRNAGKALSDPKQSPQAPDHVAALKKQANLLADFPKSGGADRPTDNALSLVNQWAAEVKALVTKGTPETAPKPDFELFEIKQVDGEVHLYKVVR